MTLSVAACYQGFNVRGGAKEVGLATTRAVVAGSVSVLVSDYFLDRYLPHPLALSIVNPQQRQSVPAVVDPVRRAAARSRGATSAGRSACAGLHKTFGPQHVLRGVDLDIERGRTNIIIGGSGQGKSVLMKHLMGLLKPDAGQIWVDGVDVVPFSDQEMGKLRRKYGMVFQYAALFDSMNVVENIAFPLLERYQPAAVTR